MFTVLGLSLAGAAYGVINEVALGGGVTLSIDSSDDIPICLNKVEIPQDVAGDDCKVMIQTQKSGDVTNALETTLNYYWKKGSASFNATMPVAFDNEDENMATVDCKSAGTYYLGAKVKSCKGCILGKNANVDVTTQVVKGGVKQTWLDVNKQLRSPWLTIQEETWTLFHFTLDAAGKPHFNMDYCSSCQFDKLKYYYWNADKVTDYSKESPDRIVVDTNAKGLAVLDIKEPGKYVFAIYGDSGATTSKSEVRVDFALNEEPSTSYPDGKCFEDDCSKEDLQSCSECTPENCNWCEATRTCSAGLTCNGGDVTTDSEKCIDISAECDKIEYCSDCVAKAGCIWCPGTFKDNCQSGKDDLAKKCETGGVVTREGIKDPMQCNSGAAVTVAASIFAAAVAMFVF